MRPAPSNMQSIGLSAFAMVGSHTDEGEKLVLNRVQ